MAMDSVAKLVDTLRQYRVVESAQLEELNKNLQSQFTDPRALARELLQRGWLTAYQVNQIFQGRAADLVLGAYIVLERLGEGGMGQVFKARHQKLNRVVAIKIIRQDRLSNAEALHRFRREIQVAAQLSHPHVVHSYDADQVGDRHLIAMEFVDGIDLSRLVKQYGPLPIRDACEYIRQAALGLQHAHEHALVHRDIKPGNLLLTKAHRAQASGEIKLLDLGLARTMSIVGEDTPSMVTRDGSLVGTPDFIAPEQARSARSADIRSDLYSLGCTLFYLLAGQTPFSGGSMTEKLLKHHWDAPPAVESLRPDVPPIVSAIVRKLMSKRPEDRFQTPRELADMLEQVLAPGGMEAPVPPELLISATTPTPASAIPVAVAAAEPVFPEALVITPTNSESTAIEPPAPPVTRVRKSQRWLWIGSSLGFILLALVAVAIGLAGRFSRSKDTRQLSIRPTVPATLPEVSLSPLDKLTKEKIPESDRVVGLPREVVAVLGEHRGRHYGTVRGVAFLPQALGLASAGEDGVVRLWDPTTLQQRNTLKGGKSGFTALACSSDGKRLAASDWNGDVRLWDMTQSPIPDSVVLKHPRCAALALAFAPDGQTLAVATDEPIVQLWDLKSKDNPRKRGRLRGHEKDVTAVAFAAMGRLLASGSQDKTVRLYDLSGPKAVTRAVLDGHKETVSAVAFAANGESLASGGEDGTVRLWDLSAKQPVLRGDPVELGGDVSSLAFAADNQSLACGLSDAAVVVLDVSAERPVQRVRLQDTTGVRAVAWSAKDAMLATGNDGGSVRIWDWNAGKPRERIPTHGHTGRVASLAFAPDGLSLASGSLDTSVRLWALNGPEAQERMTLSGKGAGITSLSFSPDGKRLAAGSLYDATLRLWDLPAPTPRIWSYSKEPQSSGAVAFADNRTLLAGGLEGPNQGMLRLWDVDVVEPRMSRVWRGHSGSVTAVAASSDGKWLASAGGSSPKVRIWDRTNQREEHELRNPKGEAIHALAFSPNNRHLVFSSGDSGSAHSGDADYTVDRWDVNQTPAVKLTPLPGHMAPVSAVAFSPDGQRLASADEDGRLILWEPNVGKHINDWRFPGSVWSLAFAPDNRHLAIGNGNGTIYILRLKAVSGRP
jgi:serine/threonine-protein kinase